MKDRIKREKLLLPVTENGEIDFQFMSSFMKRIEEDLLNTTIETFKNRLNVNKCEINLVTSECWAYFMGYMTELMIEILNNHFKEERK